MIICHATFYGHPVGEFAFSFTTLFHFKAHCVIIVLSWVSSLYMFGHKIDFVCILLPETWISIPEMGTCIIFISCVFQVHWAVDWNYRAIILPPWQQFLFVFQNQCTLALLCNKMLITHVYGVIRATVPSVGDQIGLSLQDISCIYRHLCWNKHVGIFFLPP